MAPRRAAGPAPKKPVNGVAKPKPAAKAPPKRAPKSSTESDTKPSAKTATVTNAANMSKKRKVDADEQDEPEEEPKTNGVKRARTATKSATPAPAVKSKPVAKKARAAKKPAVTAAINQAPTQRLDVYVFGNGENSELGLGSEKSQLKVKRPRLNPLLAADKIGVVAIAIGGMHTAVLTHDNKILTWGVNDQGALGRGTDWEGGLRDMDADDDNEKDDDSDSDDSDTPGPNPYESTPGEVDISALPKGIVWTQIACSDSATFALTDQGLVYAWGTFRDDTGIFGFKPIPHDIQHKIAEGKIELSDEDKIERRPMLVEGLKDITQVATGANHVLALTTKGEVYAWGAGFQNQLGRRTLERHKYNYLIPTPFGLKKDVILVGAGSYHSFAVQKNGKVFGWGLNTSGQTGHPVTRRSADVHNAIAIKSLEKFGRVVSIDGGAHHSIAVTEKGELLTWGLGNGGQTGIDFATVPEAHIAFDDVTKQIKGLKVPTRIPGIDAVQAAAGTDHCVAVAKDGKAYAWGFSVNYQTGLGTDDDVPIATHIDNTATRGKQLVQAECGGQFSALAGLAGVGTTNGV